MAELPSDDSSIIDESMEKPPLNRNNSNNNTKLTKILFNDEVQKAIEQVSVLCPIGSETKPYGTYCRTFCLFLVLGFSYRSNG